MPSSDSLSAATSEPSARLVGQQPAGEARCRIVAALVAASCDVGVDLLLGPLRCCARVATARQLAMYLAHVGLGLSQTEVAIAFGRDRSTIAHACRRIEDRRDTLAFDRKVAQMEECLHWAMGR